MDREKPRWSLTYSTGWNNLVLYMQSQNKTRTLKGKSGRGDSRGRFLAGLPDLREVLRGSLVKRFRRCGRGSCHCADQGDPGHGPAYFLVVTLAPGKTIQVYVPAEHKKAVQMWIKNFQRARRILEKVSTVNRGLLKRRKLFERG